LLRSVERLLRVEGFRVMLAADGWEALQQLEAATDPPDLIISDVSMPQMDGFELFETVRQRDEWLGIPFLFLTARDQRGDLQRGYSLGADDYLVKPLDQERLLMIIRGKLKRRAELLEHIQVQQRALDAAKRELALMVAHELRTPLVSISMVTDILAREIDQMATCQVQELLDTMRGGNIRLTRLIEQMVMYVQLQSGALGDSIRRNERPSLVHDVVVGAVERARQFDYRQRDIPISLEENATGLTINGDVVSLKHALAELISNAMSFSSPDDEVTLVVSRLGDEVCITVNDQGPGIPAEHLDRIFEPYHQINRHRYEQQGIGIGLALAEGIVKAHGGMLTLQSREGQGTQVTIRLPCWQC
jgi:two-component system sensor histidine kinase/response regulator